MTAESVSQVDQNGLKTGQAATIILLILGFILNAWILVVVVAVSQLLGALAAPLGPYKMFYDHVVRASGLLKPKMQADNPEPHRFAMLLGALFNFTGAGMLLADWAAGWVPVWIVIVLANLNFWVNFCAGCWMYYRFNRLGIPGFTKAPVA